jgi:hypothetical protein
MRNQPSRSRMPLILIFVGILLVIGAAFSLLYYFNGTSGATNSGVIGGLTNQPPNSTLVQAPIDVASIPRTSPAEAKAAQDAGTAMIIDVRPAESYDESHIAGALSIPLADLASRVSELHPQDWIITYCT